MNAWLHFGDAMSGYLLDSYEIPPANSGPGHWDNYGCFTNMLTLGSITGPYTVVDTGGTVAIQNGFLRLSAGQTIQRNAYGSGSFPRSYAGSANCRFQFDNFRATPGAAFMIRLKMPNTPGGNEDLLYFGLSDGLDGSYDNFRAGFAISHDWTRTDEYVVSPFSNNPRRRHFRGPDSGVYFPSAHPMQPNELWDFAILTGIIRKTGSDIDLRDVVYTPTKGITGDRQDYKYGALLAFKKSDDTNDKFQIFGPMMEYDPDVYSVPMISVISATCDVEMVGCPKNDLTSYAVPAFLMENGSIVYTNGTQRTENATTREFVSAATDDGVTVLRPQGAENLDTAPKLTIPNMTSSRVYRDGGSMQLTRKGGNLCMWINMKQNQKHSYGDSGSPNNGFFATRVQDGYDPTMDTVNGTMASMTHTSSGYASLGTPNRKNFPAIENAPINARMWAGHNVASQYRWCHGNDNTGYADSLSANWSSIGFSNNSWKHIIITDEYDDGKCNMTYYNMQSDLTDFILPTRDDFGQYEHRYVDTVLINEQTRVQFGFGYETSNHNTSVVYNDFGLANICLWEGVDLEGLDKYFQCFNP